ncbi:MAG: tRNA (guanosine(46)-N7)-methyltransferase TrmB [Candidatus Cloacimonetes bacterium]|nr:tRNA (guanosine(46)-N7)-methyltransferase TrmB [Candidatus Cloacimonadota bacterium]
MKMVDLENKETVFLLKIIEDTIVDNEQIFNNENPLCWEIGSGKGEFIREMSLRYPQLNFIGFELKPKRVNFIIRNLDVEKNQNVKICQFFVDASVKKVFKAESIEKIFINHPDPWPKRRHHKNRLFNAAFLDSLAYVLKKGGEVKVATDHKEYADWIIKHFKQDNRWLALHEGYSTMVPGENHIVTYFETIKRKEGFEPIFMSFRKVL